MPETIQRGAWTIVSFVLGPAMTNAYLLGVEEQHNAVVIDPAWDGQAIVQEAERRGWRISNIWLTHAHFDHFGGAAAVADAYETPVPVSLHPADHPLWRNQGGAAYFGFGSFDPGPEPTIDLAHGMELHFGSTRLEVRHTPGHCPGHVMFSARDLELVFCGDLIFQSGVGRTDLPGGDWQTLLRSIDQEILVLPDETLLLSGHGPATTVGQERRSNPFVAALR